MSVLDELRRIQERDGRLTPDAVLDDARDPSSALHPHFEWDDTTAAEQYRIVQAYGLIRRYSISIESTPEEYIRVRAFVNVGEREYIPVEQAMADPEARDRVMQQAMRDVTNLRRKYEHLCDFDAVLRQQLAKRSKRKGAAA